MKIKERSQSNIKTLIFVLFPLVFLLNSPPSMAGGLAKATNNMPWVTSIQSDDHSIWFAAMYHGGLVLRFNKGKETWDSFYYPDYPLNMWEIHQIENEVRFVSPRSVITFNKNSMQWKKEKAPRLTQNLVMRRGNITFNFDHMTKREIERRTFKHGSARYLFLNAFIYKLEDEEVTQVFELPKLTMPMFLEYRPEMRSGTFLNLAYVARIENLIGPFQRIGNKVWFGFSFYGAEGWTGVGGLAFFDLKKEQLGIMRLPPLRGCSVSSMSVDGDWLWFVTLKGGEYGPFACNGIVKFNRENGEYLIYEPPFQPSGTKNLEVYSIHPTSGELWMATPYGITRYKEKDNQWIHYAMDKVKLQDGTEAWPGIKSMDKQAGILSDRLPAGEYNLIWSKFFLKDLSYFEIHAPFKTTGWVKEKEYHILEKLLRRKYWEQFNTISALFYSGPDPLSPVVGYIEAAPTKKLEEKKGWVKVETNARWVAAKDVILQVRTLKTGKDYKARRIQAETENVTEVMEQNVKNEFFQREEALQTAEVTRDEICIIDADNLECRYPGPMFVRIKGFYDRKKGAENGFYWVDFTMNPEGAEGHDFNLYPIAKQIISGEKRKFRTIKSESFGNRVLIDVVDYKVRPETHNEKTPETVFEWIKFRVNILKITDKSTSSH